MDGAVVRRWCRLAADALGQTRSAIDALNVYPVPDADTGTNLYRTLRSAAQAAEALPAAAGPGEVWRAAADGAMLGACGNSGIIVSQLLRGLADICAPASPCDGRVVAGALRHAAGLARTAVSRPAEGTVLTVADAAARAAGLASAGLASAGLASAGLASAAPALSPLAAVVLAAATAARQALGLTTGQLDALAASGVVDAGGAGLCIVLEAWAAAVGATAPGAFAVPRPARPPATRRPGPAAPPAAGRPDGPRSPGYEVMYLLEAAAAEVSGLREELDAMGDSLVIAGGSGSAAGAPPATGLWSVHVHVPDAGAAIEAGLRAGRPRRITVTYLGVPPATGHRVLAICDTAGMAALAASAGAEVIRTGPAGPPDAAELSAVIRRSAQRCIVVPNGPGARDAALTAARQLRGEAIEVRVADVRSAVQALPALAVHEPAAEFGADAAAMDRAAARMRSVSIDVRPVPGLADAVLALTDQLLAGGPELVTFLIGEDAPAGLAELAAARIRAVSPATEVDCHAGAAAGAVLLAGAE
jgi:hypothetical protein